MCVIFANIWFQIKQYMSNYHPLKVVGGASETQLKMGEKLNLAGTMG